MMTEAEFRNAVDNITAEYGQLEYRCHDDTNGEDPERDAQIARINEALRDHFYSQVRAIIERIKL